MNLDRFTLKAQEALQKSRPGGPDRGASRDHARAPRPGPRRSRTTASCRPCSTGSASRPRLSPPISRPNSRSSPGLGRRARAALLAAARQAPRPRREDRPRVQATTTSPPSTSSSPSCATGSRRPRRLSSRRGLSEASLLAALKEVRGSAPRGRPGRRGEVPGAQALREGPDRAGPARASSTRSSAATRRSAASCRS